MFIFCTFRFSLNAKLKCAIKILEFRIANTIRNQRMASYLNAYKILYKKIIPILAISLNVVGVTGDNGC